MDFSRIENFHLKFAEWKKHARKGSVLFNLLNPGIYRFRSLDCFITSQYLLLYTLNIKFVHIIIFLNIWKFILNFVII